MDRGTIVLVLGVADVLFASGVTIHAVLWKRDPRSAIAWVGLAWLAPFIGSAAYVSVGINRIERRARSLRSKGSEAYRDARPLNRPATPVTGCASEMGSLVTAVGSVTGRELTRGNSVVPLRDGDEAFPAMLEAIVSARRTIGLLTYLFDHDRIGERFVEELVAAHRRGVQVRVLVDAIGARYSRPNTIRRLRAAGVPAAPFLPTRLPRIPRTANLRNHRKILVVDGAIGFTGGSNIREAHALGLEPPRPARCLHFELAGPVVAHLQSAFATDWEFTTGERLDDRQWLASPTADGSVWARGIEDGPDEDFGHLSDVISSAIASARTRIRIMTPYFLPDLAIVAALNTAALRGVQVEIYLPSTNNVALVHWAAAAQLWQVLEKGCRVFYTRAPFDHSKLMVVDDCWTLLGSTNWDPRSLRLNFEFNVECYCDGLASELHDLLDEKGEGAQEVTRELLDQRSFPVRLRDGVARLFSPFL